MFCRRMSLLLLLVLLVFNADCGGQYTDCRTVFYEASGTITSPNYPSPYFNNANCTYTVQSSVLSSISLRIQDMEFDSGSQCSSDWVELSCRSHSVAPPVRYCGTGSYLNPVTFSPCTQATIQFSSNGFYTYAGFSLSYTVVPIECSDNCTLLSNSFGYICSCNADKTVTVTMPTLAPSLDCMGGCYLSNSYHQSSHLYCYCMLSGSRATTCPPQCYVSYDSYGYRTCHCGQSSTSTTCPAGCYRATNEHGVSQCNCTGVTNRPLLCPYGCYADSDLWGNRYCNCPPSTQPPIWCSSGCTSAVNVYGSRYCRCPTTTLPPCFSPCYYSWDYTYAYSGRRICYCPPTTTDPPPTGCNQTLTANSGIVTSPNYPGSYTRGIDCYQHISVAKASFIKIRVLDVDLYYSYSTSCTYDYVEIFGCDESVTTFCASSTVLSAGLTFHCTESPRVTIRFHSYGYSYGSLKGFKLSYNAGFASNCSDYSSYLFAGSQGVITSPNYPNNFPGHSECLNYLFKDDDNIKIKITFDQLRLEDSTTCSNVFIKLTCQDDSEQSETVCGTHISGPMTFDCPTLRIWFKSNATTPFSPRYFKLKYFTVSQDGLPLPPLPGYATDPTLVPGTGSDKGRSEEAYTMQIWKLGVGLGVGVGGFLLVVLIVIVIVIFLATRRQASRAQRRRLDDLAIICDGVRGSGGNIRILRSAPARPSSDGLVNPLEETVTTAPGCPPSYSESGLENTYALEGFVADQTSDQLI